MQDQIISMQKDQVISLTKDSGLRKGLFGLGWKPARRGTRVDLDASCLAIDSDGNGRELVYFNHQVGVGGAVSLSGDDLTGADDGEGADAPDETITIDLEIVPEEITTLVIIVNSYSGQTFGAVEDVFCRVTDYYSGQILLEYDLDEEYSNATAVAVAKVQRCTEDLSQWDFKAIGKGFSGGLREIGSLYGMRFG